MRPDGVRGMGAIRGHWRNQICNLGPTAIPNIPALTSRQGFRNSSGTLAIFAAIRRASLRVTKVTAQVRTAKYCEGGVLSKGSPPMHLVLVFTVAVGLYVLGMIVLALAAILGRMRGNRRLRKLEPEPRPGDY